jgi:hypothetical protein
MIGWQRKKERKTHRGSRVLVNFSGEGGSGSNSGDVLELLGDDGVDDGAQENTTSLET